MEQKSKPIIMRYPQRSEADDSPFILFTRHRASYDSASTSTGQIQLTTNEHVALYMPMGININDNMVFDYTFKRGICKSKNATTLMKQMGIAM